MDRYQNLRELPFPAVAAALGIDLSKFKQRKSGTEWAGPCPVHRPKKNSTSFSYAADGKYQCFSCSAKGRGAIDLTKDVTGVGFQAATETLETLLTRVKQAGDARKPSETAQASTPQELPAENPAKKFTYEKHYVPCDWLAARGFDQATLDRYGVGRYDNPSRQSAYKGRVLIRMQRFSDGEVVGYLARDIRPEQERGESPKYAMPTGIHKALEVFGAWQLKALAPIRVLYVVESPLSVMKFHQLGFPAVSTYGWHVSQQQAAIIAQLCRGALYLPDRDKFREAAAHVGELAKLVWIKMPRLPTGIDDPEKLSAEQIRYLT